MFIYASLSFIVAVLTCLGAIIARDAVDGNVCFVFEIVDAAIGTRALSS